MRWIAAFASAFAALSTVAAQAAPADDHKRGLQAYHRGDVAGAMQALRPAVAAGHAPSQALLAHVLISADATAEAAKLYAAAAEQNDADGHAGLAGLLLVGRGLAKDEKRALVHFSKAAALGHVAAAEVVASAWIKGQQGADAAADPATAREAVQRAAALGHLPSADALAEAYRSGRFGLAPDAAQAERWRTQATAWRAQRAAASAPQGAAPAAPGAPSAASAVPR